MSYQILLKILGNMVHWCMKNWWMARYMAILLYYYFVKNWSLKNITIFDQYGSYVILCCIYTSLFWGVVETQKMLFDKNKIIGDDILHIHIIVVGGSDSSPQINFWVHIDWKKKTEIILPQPEWNKFGDTPKHICETNQRISVAYHWCQKLIGKNSQCI